MGKCRSLSEEEYLALSREERKEYRKTLPINEGKADFYKSAILIEGDVDEYMKSIGSISLEDFQKNISNKYGI